MARMGNEALAELWALVKRYVAYATAGQTSPPVGYCLINSGTDPTDDGYAGTWELVCTTDLGGGYLYPGEATYPGEDLYARPIGPQFWIWRRTE